MVSPMGWAMGGGRWKLVRRRTVKVYVISRMETSVSYLPNSYSWLLYTIVMQW